MLGLGIAKSVNVHFGHSADGHERNELSEEEVRNDDSTDDRHSSSGGCLFREILGNLTVEIEPLEGLEKAHEIVCLPPHSRAAGEKLDEGEAEE